MIYLNRISLSLCTAIGLIAAAPAGATVRLDRLFTDHMVLQRAMPVPIWGTASPNEVVNVSFRDQQKQATAGADGRWMLKLDPLKAGGPDTLTAGEAKVTDVLVGEVWLGSGQSNMAMTATAFVKTDPALAEAASQTYPSLRLLGEQTGGWQVAAPVVNGKFSALMLSFGGPLQKHLNIPIGLIVSAASGTPSARWLTKEMIDADSAAKGEVDAYAAANPLEKRQAQYQIDLDQWQQAAGAAKAQGKPAPTRPTPPGDLTGAWCGDLYKVMIRPLEPFAIRGVLWDQGENYTAMPGVDEQALTGALIKGWRNAWGEGDFPFLYVLKPSGGGCAWDAAEPVTTGAIPFAPLPSMPTEDVMHRENFVNIMNTAPNVYMVETTDLVMGGHPPIKTGYGARAARTAMAAVYDQPIEYLGPLFQSYQLEGNRVRVHFSHVGQGLAFKHGDGLHGFQIAGDDRAFRWANARIDGADVVVWSAAVPSPVAVRYAWGFPTPWANLFNRDGLPAIMFRTDRW